MNLGWRASKIDTDPEGAGELLDEAQDELEQATSSSCATWPAASTRRCSPTAASTRRSTASPPVRRSRSRSTSTPPERLAERRSRRATYFVSPRR